MYGAWKIIKNYRNIRTSCDNNYGNYSLYFLASSSVLPSSRTVKIPPIKKIATTMNANITIVSDDINF